MNVQYCYKSFSGTTVRVRDSQRVPIIGACDLDETHYVYPFKDTQEAREFCKDLIDICDRLDKMEAEKDERCSRESGM